MIKKFKRGESVQLSANFNLSEYECRCGSCDHTLVDLSHIKKLQALRDLLGKPIKITSAYRCEAHNKAVDGSPNSQHPKGTATDIQTTDLELLGKVCEAFDGLGIYDTFVHVDSRGSRARWDNRKVH